MSLVNEYKNQIREKLGINQNPAIDLSNLDETSLNSLLELIQSQIDNKVASGETSIDDVEGMEDPQIATTDTITPDVPNQVNPGMAVKEAEMVADDVYFEMLNTFKEKIGTCEEASRKNMYKRCYEMCYKMRDKFIKEMLMSEEA